MLKLLHFLIGASMPLAGIDILANTTIGQNPVNASNPSKLIMIAVALIYLLRLTGRRKLTVSRETIFFVSIVYGSYFLGNIIDVFWFIADKTNRIPSVTSFLVTPALLYVVPYLAVKSMLTNPQHLERYIQGVFISLCWMTLISFIQFNYLFGSIPSLASLYGDILYKLVESRWGGWGSSFDISHHSPLIGFQLRPAVSFPEPSVFSSYIFLVAAPLFIAMRHENISFMSNRMIKNGAFLVLLLLVLSLSTTAALALASLALYHTLAKLHFKACTMIIAYIPIFVIINTSAILLDDQIGQLAVGSTSLETRFGGMIASIQQVIHTPWGSGFRFFSESLGQYIPQWARNTEFYAQQDEQWFVSTFFGMQVVAIIGVIPFFGMLYLAYQQIRQNEQCAPIFSRRLLHAYIWILIVSSFSAIQYQEPWFIYGISIAYLFPRAGVGLSNGRIFIRRLHRDVN